MDIGFLILSPDKKLSGVKNTLTSIEHYAYGRNSICVVGEDADDQKIKDFNQSCKTYKGESTITSLINTGMKKIKNEWAFIIFGGSRIHAYLEKKFVLFAKDESDVLFPVVDGKYNFVEGSFNGVLINTKFFKKVGEFASPSLKNTEHNDFELAKMLWAISANNHGVKFKAIVGMKII